MIPILYAETETKFTSMGLGQLTEIQSNPQAIEELNGVYEFYMTYPLTGSLASEIKEGRYIKVKANQDDEPQIFIIIRVRDEAGEVKEIYAEHITQHRTRHAVLEPLVEFIGNAQVGLETWKANLIPNYPEIEVYSDITLSKSGKWTVDEVGNARLALGGVQGSLLDLYGGEYKFTNNRISLLANRGRNRGLKIQYGRNLTDLVQDKQIAETYTSIQPYFVRRLDNVTVDGERIAQSETITLPEKILHGDYVEHYIKPKIRAIDFTFDDSVTDEASLRSRARRYLSDNEVGKPIVNLNVSFLDLSKTEDYKDIAEAEKVALGDTVEIEFKQLGINVQSKIVRTIYNPLTETYSSIQIGQLRASMGSIVERANEAIELAKETREELEGQVSKAIISADGKNTNFFSDTEPKANATGDLWYKEHASGTFEMFIWNGTQWVALLDTQAVSDELSRIEDLANDLAEEVDEIENKIDLRVEKDENGNATGIVVIGEDGRESILMQVNEGKVLMTEDYFYIQPKLITNEMLADNAVINNLQGQTLNFNDIKGINLDINEGTVGTLRANRILLSGGETLQSGITNIENGLIEVVKYGDLATAGRTAIDGNNIKTGRIQDELGANFIDLDIGAIDFGKGDFTYSPNVGMQIAGFNVTKDGFETNNFEPFVNDYTEADMKKVENHIRGLKTIPSGSSEYRRLDINRNGILDIADMTIIEQMMRIVKDRDVLRGERILLNPMDFTISVSSGFYRKNGEMALNGGRTKITKDLLDARTIKFGELMIGDRKGQYANINSGGKEYQFIGGILTNIGEITDKSAQSPIESVVIPRNSNLNSYRTPGFYHSNSDADMKTVANHPSGSAGSLLVLQNAGATQFWVNYHTGNPKMFVRNEYSGSWGAWSEVGGTSSVAWSAVTGKPSTFAPSSHTHEWSAVTSKPTTATRWPSWSEVTGKPSTFAPSSHTHAYQQLARTANGTTGTITNATWTRVTYGKTFATTPAVVATGVNNVAGDSFAKIRNRNTTGFEIIVGNVGASNVFNWIAIATG